MGKNIVICMDGTWNDPTERTNAYRLFQAVEAGPEVQVGGGAKSDGHIRREGPGVVALYVEGVGADGKQEGLFGGTLGTGLHARVLRAFLLASREYQRGDKFWIFGFSRGAWSARSLAGLISNAGLLAPDQTEGLPGLERANRLWVETKLAGPTARAAEFWKKNDENPIALVGVWDTVGALGIPFLNGLKPVDFAEKHLLDFADLKLSLRVMHGRHAVSIDERRKDFEPTLWEPRLDGSIKELWFAGVHADVGGGYPRRGLSDIALKWMAEEAQSLAGGPLFDLTKIDPLPLPDPIAHRHDEALRRIWKLRPTGPRQLPPGAELHASVLTRLKARPDYRPAGLRTYPTLETLFGADVEEEIFPLDDGPDSLHLEPGAASRCDVFAENCWNFTGFEVKKGQSYKFTAPAGALWKDRHYEASAAGYDSKNFLMKSLESARRVKESKWFCLIACVHREPTLESHNPEAGNLATGWLQSLTHKVGKYDSESQLVAVGEPGKRLEVDRDGYLYLFANDAPFAYSNNSGYLPVTVERAETAKAVTGT